MIDTAEAQPGLGIPSTGRVRGCGWGPPEETMVEHVQRIEQTVDLAVAIGVDRLQTGWSGSTVELEI